MSKDSGYMFPTPIDPGEYQCLTVYVPKHALYLAAFWRAFEYFTTWHAWQRDAAHTGLDVAALWQVGFDMSRAALLSGDGCNMFDVRQNPTTPCALEYSTDGGESWIEFADLRLCAGNISIGAPYPGSTTGAEDAAASVVRNIFEGLINLLDCELQTRDEYIAAALAHMRTYDPTYNRPDLLGGVYDAACALTPEQRAEFGADCPYFDHFNNLSACADVEGLFDWLNCLAELMANWLNSAGNTLMDWLNKAAGALTGNGVQSAAFGGEGGGAGFGGTCVWEVTFDFSIAQYGFEQYTHQATGFYTGEYVPPLVVGPCHNYGGGTINQQGWWKKDPGAIFRITDVEVFYTTAPTEAGALYIERLDGSDNRAELQAWFINNNETSSKTFTNATGEDIKALILGIRTNTCTGDNQINSVRIAGKRNSSA